MGENTVEFNQKLRYALGLVRESDRQGLYGGAAAPMIERLELMLGRGADFEEFWAFFAHGNRLPSTAGLVEGRRDWYEWTKDATKWATLARLTPEQLDEFAGGIELEQAGA